MCGGGWIGNAEIVILQPLLRTEAALFLSSPE